ncbi:putative glycosyl hydrolase family 81 protein [Phytophthora sojae]|uniref:glucan endo-1,3-beta-D-glucosidase n=1 Tax=Phytophthora sojae (strain P6497) TaxID=1094619 RepID=G5AGI1_PHYSP|nr:putative glycosyl hydrolase family 81 protein [Phytophthora sojae]EGZ05261.1 putative glycosyl hydrolase family 81 protein [Phytophthora sojae]|eukprot:XP_009539182.1 putative glycosyl hydrolase family 81 protein [Phytophthora sojae]
MRSRGSYVLARLEQFFDDTIVLASRNGELPVVEALREYASYIALTESFFEAVRWYSLVRDHREIVRLLASNISAEALVQAITRCVSPSRAGMDAVRVLSNQLMLAINEFAASVIDEDPRGFVINPVLDEEIIEAGRTGAIQTGGMRWKEPMMRWRWKMEHTRDFGCQLLVRFTLQDEKEPDENGIVVDAQFTPNSATSATGDGALQCVFPAALPGFYELEGKIIAHDSNAAIQPIWPNPYSLQMVVDNAPFGMSVSYPYRNRFSGSSSGNNGAVKFYAHGQVREFMFSAVEMQQKPNFQVVDWADQGMVYTSMKYSGLTPRLVSSAATSSVNGQPLGGQVRGSKFVIAYNSGQKWVIYALSSDGRMEDCSVGLLHFAMKHQVESIDTSAGARKAFTTPGGSADPVWEIKETQPVPEDFYPARKIAFAVAQQQRVLDHLREDINAAWSIPLDGSYYFNGKAAQKYASLCLIANDAVVIYGGIVSSQGLKTKDLNSDFGNTMYNDHHFHYGYWGKDQESTSEDVNFAFGMYMFGKATNNAALEAVGKLMTRVNAHAIKAYFLIEDANQIHPTNFRLNKVTGIFFDNKFVKEEWEQVLNKETIVTREDTWLSLLYASFAMVDKQRALGVLQKAKMDDGLSRSWALYMAASFAE